MQTVRDPPSVTLIAAVCLRTIVAMLRTSPGLGTNCHRNKTTRGLNR